MNHNFQISSNVSRMNTILKSLRHSKTILDLTNSLTNSKDSIEWSSFKVQECGKYLDFYADVMKWMARKGELAQQYATLSVLIDRIYKSKEKILDSIIDTVPGLRDYMLIHSVFDTSDNDQSDWLAAYMIDKLNYTFAPEKQDIPREILDKLKIFNPETEFIERDYVILTYGMWKKGSNGRLLDPINTNYWGDIQEKPVDMVPIIASYTPLNFDDDLPF